MFENGLATKTDYVTVYNYNENGEFTGESTILVEEGTGIPAQSTLEKVIKEKEGFARVFNEKWIYVEDHRGEKYYSTEDGSEVEIKELGVLPENVTKVPRPTQWHNFLNGEWVLDEAAKDEAEKQAKIDVLNAEMTRLRNDIIFGQAMGDDISQYKERVIEVRLELEKLQS